jgi:hypothetical protein
MIMGQHKFLINIDNSTPSGITTGISGADDYLTGVSATNISSANNGLRGDVVVGFFKVLHESYDGDSYFNQKYFMVTNGLSDGSATAAQTQQTIHLTFNFGSSGITSLQRLSRTTGQVETVSLVSDGGGVYHLDLTLDGGTGDLFKYNTGAPFVGVEEAAVPVLAVSPATQSVANTAGAATFTVSNTGMGTMAWTAQVTSGSAWLSITSGTSGTNSGSIVVSTLKNSTYDARTGTITVIADGATGSPVTVTVTQAPADLIPGDANKDGAVNVSDLSLLAANYGATSGATWGMGDFNKDGAVNVSDLSLLAANYGTGSTSTLSWADAYEQAFGTTSDAGETADDSSNEDDTGSTMCSSLGLSLIAGLALMGLMLVKLEE